MITLSALSLQAQSNQDILSTHACPGQPVISVGCFLRMRAKEEILKWALKGVAK